MKKKDREIVYNKYGGKCAYCGFPLQKGWHVDELLPVKRVYSQDYDFEKKRVIRKPFGMTHPERMNISNQMPSCASCNVNKRAHSLEEFRALIEGFLNHLNNRNVQYKIAKRYGLVQEFRKPVVFYFETFCKTKSN